MIFETRYLPRFIDNGIALFVCGFVRADLPEPLMSQAKGHERKHLRQQWILLILFPILYFFSRSWGRLHLEAQAYAEDVRLGRDMGEVIRILSRTCRVSRQRAEDTLLRYL